MLPSNLRPIRLSRRSEPFDSKEFLFELKIDGFRALAYIDNGECRLVSRNGNRFRGFADLANWIGQNLPAVSAVLDGEIACIDESGRPIFQDLLFRRRQCLYFAFDLLFLNGDDLRELPLVERKARLKTLIQKRRSRMALCRSHRAARLRILRQSLRTGSGRRRRQAEGLAVSGNGEALSALDQNQEPELQSGRGPRGIVRAGVNAAGLNASFRGTPRYLTFKNVTSRIQEYPAFSSASICGRLMTGRRSFGFIGKRNGVYGG